MPKQKITIEIDGDGKGAETAIGGVSAKTIMLGNIMADIAKAAVDVLTTSIKQLGEELKKTVGAAAESEKKQLMLGAAMQQAGIYTKEAFQHNLNYASSLQKISTYDDEAIAGAQKMLVSFGLEGKMLDDVTKATLDLATAKEMDLQSAADVVAKSIGSSTNALSRYGIAVSDSTDKTQRATEIVDGISRLFGGQAAASARTFSGLIAQQTNLWGDLYEEIGFAVVGNEGMRKVMETVKTITIDLTNWVIKNRQEIMIWVTTGIVIAIKAFEYLVDAMAITIKISGMVATGFMVMGEDIFATLEFIIGGWRQLLEVMAAAAGYIPGIGASMKAGLMVAADTIGIVEKAMAAAKSGFRTSGDAIAETTVGITETMGAVSTAAAKLAVNVQNTTSTFKPLTDALQETGNALNANLETYTAYLDASIGMARGYTDAELAEFEKRKMAMDGLLATNQITQEQYNNWFIAAGKKVNNEVALQTEERMKMNATAWASIASISKTYSDQILVGQASFGKAMTDSWKASMRGIIDAEIDKAVMSIGIKAAEQIGLAAVGAPLSFGATLAFIPLIAAAATGAKAIIHGIAGFAAGGLVGPGGSKLPLPSFASAGSGAPALVMAHEGEAIGTPGALAAAGVGNITVIFNNYAPISSELDVDTIGNRLGQSLANTMKGSI